MKALLEKIRKLLRDRRVRKFWHRSLSVFAAVVVFITTYALVLPAITLEKTAACGIEEHQHNKSCYESRLVCGQEESEGHHHDDSCYTVTKELECDLEEHQHSDENGCYDAEGNLICEISEHAHDSSCYQEIKTLTCDKEESDGHHHTDACYEEVLVCGKEVHTHSSECYKEDSSAVSVTEEAAGGASTVTSGESDSADNNTVPGESAEDGNAGMTDVAGESAVSDPSVPQLDPVDMDVVMTKSTGFYYFHAEEDEDIPANSSDITNWQEVKEDTKLASTDLVKAYFTYKIPAGSLNESNPVARYRLPGNIHLTDDQIDAINHTENGVYASMDSGEEARKYLGAEAVEGDRKPDEELRDGAQEYISAVVRAENVYDEEDHYLGQDLIFTFVPYTIEKNQNTYDADGSQLTAGEKITGWFACDFTLSQIDWVKEETDLDNSTIEKSAEVVFVEENKENGTKEISTVLKLIENDDTEAEDGTETDAEDTDTAEYQSGTLTADGDGYKITLDYTEEAKIPANADLSVKEITPETDKEAYEACLEQAKKQVTGDDKSTVDETASRFFDIEIVVRNIGDDADESESVQKIEPAAPVSVNIQITDTSRNADSVSESGKTEQSDPTVLHFAEEGVEQIDSTVKDSSEQTNDGGQSTEVQFEAESFSVYGVVYTVDFEYSVDGQVYQFSLPGGGFVSFTELVEALGIADNAKEFVADVVSLEFSSPELVWIGKTEAETTVGALKATNGLACEYSADLTEEQIAEINSKEVESGDWALISMQPFVSVEDLTVTMSDGEVFTIRVTDAQISKDFITAKGETYTITVIYDEGAEIPDDANLNVREIEEGTDEYQGYLNDAAAELGLENADGVSFARFFDIVIVDGEDNKIEPKTPVEVKIEYTDAIEINLGDALSVVHFGEEDTEVISDLTVSDDVKEIAYEQGSFSVTGTVVAPQNNGSQYMVLIKGPVVEGQNIYYIVNNDGTLSPVETEWNPNGSLRAVHVTEPMTWEYNNNHLYHEYDARAYNPSHAAAEFLYRYLNPGVESGLTTEENADVTLGQYNNWTQMYQNSQRRLWDSTAITYNAQNHRLSNGGKYLGVSVDADGTVRIAGNKSATDAAEVFFASPEVAAPTTAQHAVNHIDISVRGTSEIEVPLAYGEYFNQSGTKILEVSKDEQKKITVESPVKIELEDMKRAVISAYQIKSDGTTLPLDNAFYVSGFSQNDPSGIGSTGDARQIRIEGSFLTSKSINGEDIDQFDNVTQTYKNRLNDRVYYTVSVTKPITFVLKDGDQELYDATGNKLTITLDITMAASFDYWDIRNECPPLRLEMGPNGQTYVNENGQNFRNWRQGGYTNWGDITGMDFQLGGDADDVNSNIVAIEITKMIMDEEGNLIKPANQITQAFDVWGSSTDDHRNVITTDVPDSNGDNAAYDRSSYRYLHSKEMKVGSSGMGLVYDYEITPGMYYIREDPSKVQQEIEDLDGETWYYKETKIETEFVWRNDDTTGRHVSATYSDLTSTDPISYTSIPEVAGNYTGKHYHNANGYTESTDYNSSVFYGWNEEHTAMVDNQQFRNGFLEYFVYNVYRKAETDITLKKVDSNDLNDTAPELLKGASFTISKYSDATFQSKDTTWGNSGSQTLTDEEKQDGTYTLNGTFAFEGLPAGYYEIEETDSPEGHIKLSDNPRFKIEENANHTLEIALVRNPDNMLRLEDNKLSIVVGNPPGAALPNTGGPGTRIFLLLGCVLILGSGALLWRRRKLA